MGAADCVCIGPGANGLVATGPAAGAVLCRKGDVLGATGVLSSGEELVGKGCALCVGIGMTGAAIGSGSGMRSTVSPVACTAGAGMSDGMKRVGVETGAGAVVDSGVGVAPGLTGTKRVGVEVGSGTTGGRSGWGCSPKNCWVHPVEEKTIPTAVTNSIPRTAEPPERHAT